MKKIVSIVFIMALLSSCTIRSERPIGSRMETTPLQFLKAEEARQKEARGDVYLGKVMTLYYPAKGVTADKKYHPYLLELTDILKTPLRKNYRLTLKGFSDKSGPADVNMQLSRERAESLKTLLVKVYLMKGERISHEAHGEAEPVASNETMEGRSRNRRVEIHVHGNITEAVRFLESEEGKR